MTKNRASLADTNHPVGVRVRMVLGLLVLVTACAVWGPGLLQGAEGSGVSSKPARFLLAAAAVLGASHLLGALMRRWRQPAVIGEILGGLLMGPSVLGLVWPDATAWLFPAEVLAPLGLAAQLGLVLFMFLLGSELRTDQVTRPGSTGVVVLGAMGVPFVAGAGIALFAAEKLTGGAGHSTASVLFFGLALSITALPVLARILVDLELAKSRVGVSALAAAATGDGAAWTVLALILANTGLSGFTSAWTTPCLAVALVLVTVFCVKPALAALERRVRDNGPVLLAVLVVGALSYAAVTELIGLHAAVGAFLFGAAAPRGSKAVERTGLRLRGFVVTVMLPLFFAQIGLSTSVALLGSDLGSWLLLAVVLVAAVGSKVVGAGAAARLTGMSGPEALRFGFLMNCRGVTELVVASIGLQYGLVSEVGFTILVLVAIVTTAVTGPLLRVLAAREAARASSAAREPECLTL
ncbi:cation:proton antiporter domain-containing protein [Streptomyces rhizosphaerihabitans]|uniref:cation:proton antiporter domain-containing protein n=1 Tax=Streptomyces rhizosphaerihabitans TaxID=1266770 RepID=UPI0021C1B37E|nr:cation:proton antiporter [Streptomyces rhizosphaerihabitans]MCT9008502.1 cation:proton antiporter [Streptomyces rhizosphaerihabitans]